ncbi:TonB-dependent receptor [Paludibacter sp.]
MKNGCSFKSYLSYIKSAAIAVLLLSGFIVKGQSQQNLQLALQPIGEDIYIDSVVMANNYSVADAILGRTAGLQVTHTDGSLGAAFDVLIRGGASLRGNKQPLFVLDGVMLNPSQLDAPAMWEAVDKTDYQLVEDMLWSISLSDVENIQVLKDASATAIYGSKGADGVILITTKTKGTKEKQITWTSNVMLSNVSKKIDFLSPTEYVDYHKQLTGLDFNTAGKSGINWQNELFKPAFSHNHSFNIRGSQRRTDYSLSLNAKQQQGIIPGTGTEDLGIRVNLNQLISTRVKMGTRFTFMRNTTTPTQSTYLLGGSSLTSTLASIPYTESGENPLGWKLDYDDDAVTWRTIPQAYISIKLMDGLDLTLDGGMDFLNKSRFRWMGNETQKGALENSRAGRSEITAAHYNVETALSFNKTYNSVHRVNAQVGGQYFGDSNTTMANYGADFSIYSLKARGISFASKSSNAVYSNSASSTVAGFANANYSYLNKYTLTAGFRADYLIGYTTRYYPSIQGAWQINEENFWKDNISKDLISSLSLEAGWGISGKNEVYPFSSLNKLSLGYGTLWVPFTDLLYFTPQLESIRNEYTVGLNMSLLEDKVRVGAKYYNAQIDDILSVYNAKPDYIEYTYNDDNVIIGQQLFTFDNLPWQNTMQLSKWGIEGFIEATVMKNSNIEWKVGANIAMDRTKVVSSGVPAWNILGATKKPGFAGASVSGAEQVNVTAFVNGYAPNVFYGYLTQGVVAAEHVNMVPPFKGTRLQVGDVKFIDMNENGQVEEGDKVVIGNPNPDFIFSINSSFRYKKLSVNALFDSSIGNDVLNLNLLQWENVSTEGNILPAAYRNRYIPSSGVGTLPAVGALGLNEITDKLVEDGSFLRLSTLSLSYTPDLKGLTWLDKLDIHLLLSNLFVISNYRGYNPDVNSFAGSWSLRGVDLGASPSYRSVSLGFTASF